MNYYHIDLTNIPEQKKSVLIQKATFSKEFNKTLAVACSAETLLEAVDRNSHIREVSKHRWLTDVSLIQETVCPPLIAGPCTIESALQLNETASLLQTLGITCIRGGAWKGRTSPYDFQGHGIKALSWLKQTAEQYNLLAVSELLSLDHSSAFKECIDIIQIGARNMQNFSLLKAAGTLDKPILLKRGFSNTYDEWQAAAEYCLYHGAPIVYMCERGIRSFEPSIRFTLDLMAVPKMQQRTWLPIMVDPSHACGDRHLVPAMSRAALAAGASGLIIEIHDQPEKALCDGPQALTFKMFEDLVHSLPNGVIKPCPNHL